MARKVEFKDTPKGKGVRTAVQTLWATVATYVTGLLGLEDVKEYNEAFVEFYGYPALVSVLVALGVSAGLISYVQNRFGEQIVKWLKKLVRR